MIRVNLLDPETTAPPRFARTARRATVAGAVLFVCTLGAVGTWGWHLGRQAAALDARLARTERQLTSSRQVANRVDRATVRKRELAAKLALIDRLRAARRGPVTLLSAVSQSVPDGLWLTELKQRGSAVQLDGRATSVTAVTEFVERLQDSGCFDRPVEIVTTSTELVDDLLVVRFAVKGQTY